MNDLTLYPVPPGIPTSDLYEVRVNGQLAYVYQTGEADFITLAHSGPAEFEVTCLEPLPEDTPVAIRPMSKGITPQRESTQKVCFRTSEPVCLSVEFGDHHRKPLFIWASQPEQNAPDPADPRVHYFRAGDVYEIGRLELNSGETIYMEGGAVLKGAIHSVDAQDIAIRGHGILDNSPYKRGINQVHSIMLETSRGILIDGIGMMRPSTWMVSLGCCEEVTIRNLKQVGEVVSSDGIDVCGTKNVLIEDCFLRNNDDCIVIKSTGVPVPEKGRLRAWQGDVENVRARRCTLLNAHAGNALEIGFELCAERIHDIVFEDIDIIAAHGEGGVFTIHNGDRATVSDVLYQNIRVEHFYSKFIDFRIFSSIYTKDDQRGHIRDITLRNITACDNRYNSVSLIGGHNEHHQVHNVLIENLTFAGQPITNADELHLFAKQAAGIEFR